MGISQNNVCKLCNANEETLIHLFTLCKPVKKFWKDLARRVKTNINRDLIFSSYIFVASEKKKTPQVVEALEMLKKIYFEQEYVSRIQNQESQF